MTIDDQTIRAIAERMVTSTPQAAALNMRFVSATPGEGFLAVPWREDLVGDPATGVLAGGVVTTLLDHCCGLATTTRLWPLMGSATLDLRIDYMRPAIPRREVIGVARCYKVTRSIAFVRAAAFEDDEADPIATAQAAFMINGQAAPAGASA